MTPTATWTAIRQLDKKILFTILVAALGYFVDIFDLLLFAVVRVPSLKSLGVPDSELASSGVFLINMQMGGILIGGFLWGVLGDKFGRLSVLLWSIMLYSVANLANAFVTDVNMYAAMRLLAGIGLAGELGAGVTLVSELLPIRLRGIGTTFVGVVGVSGAVFAGFLGDMFPWQTAYIIGGGMGFVLLCLRIGLKESGMYAALAENHSSVRRGDLLALFCKKHLLRRYAAAFLIPLPMLAVIWILVAFTPEFSKAFGAEIPFKASYAIVFHYIGLTFGDGFYGLFSQYLQNRRKAIALSLVLMVAASTAHILIQPTSPILYYGSCGLMGLLGGYWIVAIQFGAEQFGTNLRATATTSIPTIARALIIPATMAFQAMTPAAGLVGSFAIVMAFASLLAALSLFSLKETFHRDLDYVE